MFQAQLQQSKVTVHTDAAHVTTRHAFKSVWLVLANHCVKMHVCYHHCNMQNSRIPLQYSRNLVQVEKRPTAAVATNLLCFCSTRRKTSTLRKHVDVVQLLCLTCFFLSGLSAVSCLVSGSLVMSCTCGSFHWWWPSSAAVFDKRFAWRCKEWSFLNGFRQKGHSSMLVLAEEVFRSKTRQSTARSQLAST